MDPSESKQNLLNNCADLRSSEQCYKDLKDLQEKPLSEIEKTFLLHAERGDVATVRRIIEEYKDFKEEFDLNCVDALNRSALISAIENENIELIKLLLEKGIAVKDGLLHAIKEEYVEAVEVLLVYEEKHHIAGDPYSWEKVDRCSSTFTADITPLILAAHKNNFEIIKILLDRGATLPMPHDVRCGCDVCVSSSKADSLQHSQSRINAYKALTAPSLIALSSTDPILTAFKLSWELRKLSRMETEFRAEYNEMRQKVQTFATSLLHHVRSSFELEVMLNYDPTASETWDPGDHQTLERLKLAIKYKQKQFVAHPNVQQLLAAIWYEGLPGFRRKGMVGQLVAVAKMGMMFPVYCTVYSIAPDSTMGSFMKKPFVKFISHSASYAFFLMLLGAASQRIEILALELFGNEWMRALVAEWKRKERGAWPGLAEYGVMIYVIGIIWGEITALYKDGLEEYVTDLWNILDFITNIFYVIWLAVRISACYITWREEREGLNPYYPREEWHIFEPMLISEGAFAAGMIFSFLKLVHIFSVNPHLGPLQISLGRMIIDIVKFFFIYTLVLMAFGCGLNQLLWYYAELEKAKCYHLPSGLPDFENQDKACTIWRRYSNLFETSQSLFWASFGLVDLVSFDLAGIKEFTRFWALLMFGSYSVINVIVLLNMLIAMMSNSYQIISERADTEWKFARSKLWMSYFEDDDDLPPPFNLMPQPKNVLASCQTKQRSKSFINKSMERSKERYLLVMKLLIRRYVTAEQRNRDDFGVSEDDVMEIRQDISSLRYELIDILRRNGMTTPKIASDEVLLAGKKCKQMERRILKDFQIGLMGGLAKNMETFGQDTKDVFGQLAKVIAKKATFKKTSKDWNKIVKTSSASEDQIGSADQQEKARARRQSLRRRSQDEEGKQRKARRFPPLADVIKLGQMEEAKNAAHIQASPRAAADKRPVTPTPSKSPTPTPVKESIKPPLSPLPESKPPGSPAVSEAKTKSESTLKPPGPAVKPSPAPAPAPAKPPAKSEAPVKSESAPKATTSAAKPEVKTPEVKPEAKPAEIKSEVKAAPAPKPTPAPAAVKKPEPKVAEVKIDIEPPPKKVEEKEDEKKSVEFSVKATTVSEVSRPSTSKSTGASAAKKNLPWL